MAKKQTNKDRINKALNKYHKSQDRLSKRLYIIANRQVSKAFDDATEETAKVYRDRIEGKTNKNLPFKYSEHKQLKKEFQRIALALQDSLFYIIADNISKGWLDANNGIDKIVKAVYPNTPNNRIEKYLSHNESAKNAFLNRKIASGRTLKGRTWLLANRYLRDIEDTLAIGIYNGDSAANIAKRINRHLDNPDAKISDINNIDNKAYQQHFNAKKAKESAKVEKVQYNSSKKHAKMLAANETNLAYRNAETERMKNLDMVVGYEIKLSNRHKVYDICDEVNGFYPKWFKWNSWHVSCYCYRIFILKTTQELAADNIKMMKGELITDESVNKVNDVPQGFKDWIVKHGEKVAKWNNKPYFWDDNISIINKVVNN